ncbi:hypothetical protein ACFPOG_12960 [Paenibacillus aestuarii]|uniref:Uncharacterized protein n=1 Tax=Paenibacillus aestuarii TaxID=516965 RepID=A0ABW0K723_9BACL
MKNQLIKVEMTWYDCLTPEQIDPRFIRQGVGKTQARPNRYNPTMVYAEITDLFPEQTAAKYRQLQNVTRGTCRSIKFHYEAEGPGALPYVELKALGFEPSDNFIWRMKHEEFDVSAIAIPHIGKAPFWVLQIEKRAGKTGVPVTACELETLLPKKEMVEVSLFDLEGVS